MKKLAILCALVALSGCKSPSVEERTEVKVSEVCYKGVTYLGTTVHAWITLTAKIDAKTLKPVNCENESN